LDHISEVPKIIYEHIKEMQGSQGGA
jgi:hypothetical protein